MVGVSTYKNVYYITKVEGECVIITRQIKWLLIGAAVVFLMIIGICGYNIYVIADQYRAEQTVYNDLIAQYVSMKREPEAILTTPPAASPRPDWYDPYEDLAPMSVADTSPVRINFSEVKQDVSEEIVGHLYCDGTKINYPVMQHADNDFYLTHDSTGAYSSAGALFLGASNFSDFSDVNSVIHGHHLKNGYMFGDIEKWGDQTWFNNHSVLYLNTPEQNYKLEAVAYYEVSKDSDAYEIDFSGEQAVADWIAARMSSAKASSGYSYYAGDRFVSLSTCVYSFSDAHGILLCKLVPVA